MPDLKPQIREILQQYSHINFLGHEIIDIENKGENIVTDINNILSNKLKPTTKGKNHG